MINLITTFSRYLLLSVLVLFLSTPISARQLAVFDGKMVAFEESSGELWTIKRKVAPDYPMKALRKELAGCVAVGYVINSNGRTTNHKILVDSASGVFNKSAIAAAKKFYYLPTVSNPEKTPALTFNTFTYQLGDPQKMTEKYKEVSEPCSGSARQALESLIQGTDSQ